MRRPRRNHTTAFKAKVAVAALKDDKTLKYEHLYLHAYQSVSEAKQQLASYFAFDNTRRPHSSLGGHTPDMTYFKNQPTEQAA